ncbi:hypothetical protein C8Q77DRAFT_324092 [Trametes polyzona]|nr:hypothetical protein C8Q77DRAFT_324092 [Trametes polyzona]
MDRPMGPRKPDKRNAAYESIFGRPSAIHRHQQHPPGPGQFAPSPQPYLTSRVRSRAHLAPVHGCSGRLLSRSALSLSLSISLACCAESLLAARSISVSLDYALPVDCPLRVNSPSESSPSVPLCTVPDGVRAPWRTPPAPACPRNAYTRSACASRTRRHRKCPVPCDRRVQDRLAFLDCCGRVSRHHTPGRARVHSGIHEYRRRAPEQPTPSMPPSAIDLLGQPVPCMFPSWFLVPTSPRLLTYVLTKSHLDRCRNTVGVLVLSPVPRPFGAQLSRRTRSSLQRAADVCNPTFRAVFIARVLGAHSSPSRCRPSCSASDAHSASHTSKYTSREGYATSASYSSMHNAVSRAGSPRR